MTSLQIAPTRSTWRVVDIVVAAVLAVASGVVFFAWNTVHHSLDFLFVAFPPASALLGGMWLFPAVLGALIIRKPGAALFCETVAAVVSSFMGSEYGWTVLASGLIQGLGAELVFAIFLYKSWGLPTALLAGAVTGLFGGINDAFIFAWFAEYTQSMKLFYVAAMTLSGLVIGGLLSWLATRALARTGALSSLASRKAAQETVLGTVRK
ncbi:ECF transporter S component [Paeniglutamicibacter cryotolerans]|uniref:Energy-coupling factor transport system substrate-specific component n=1 Tax=Paeniglutamicibacter cryotolerans TaxID=670079 RepID=A0A839QEE9_9MICC|nr:ECF transporter S component [Paeniglutamicibacter cryotolerans]MBB2994290.1 energy-coupling factor transport system substrate-specific component [Paeniglutamicibacter cryotolerans]